MLSSLLRRLAFLLVLTAVIPVPVPAVDRDDVRVRMAERLGAVDELKDRGRVGENNRGYLEARGSLAAPE